MRFFRDGWRLAGHGMIAACMIQVLGEKLPKGCKVLTSDVKVRVVATGLSTFPDISVVCGDLERASDDANAITNPALLVEVLNPSTEDYDQGVSRATTNTSPASKRSSSSRRVSAWSASCVALRVAGSARNIGTRSS